MANIPKINVKMNKKDVELSRKDIVKYYKKQFEEKWNNFCQDELGEYEIDEIHYLKKSDLFLLRERNRYIKVKIHEKELKNKLMSISEIIEC